MEKVKVVVFGEGGARIYTNPPNMTELMKLPNVLVNPDMGPVMGVSPDCWHLKDGKLVAGKSLYKAPAPAANAPVSAAAPVVQNFVYTPPKAEPARVKSSHVKAWLIAAAVAALLGGAAAFITRMH